jgi:hypothetical protein
LGEDEGRVLRAESGSWMATEGVLAPARFVKALLPVRH